LEIAGDILDHVANRKIMHSAIFKSPVVEVIMTFLRHHNGLRMQRLRKHTKQSKYPITLPGVEPAESSHNLGDRVVHATDLRRSDVTKGVAGSGARVRPPDSLFFI
jgi:hypothetical protein